MFCTEKKYSPYYYILFSHLRSGLNRPEKIKNIQANYDINILTLELQWDPSIDPDTNQFVPYYFIYLYYEYPKPEQYYDKKYLLDITSQNQYLLYTGTFVGNLYFIITAYDLGAESEISDILKVEIP
ncbi:MAG: hypothetical protein KatS3mg129_2098 [Leptospiraceae bacterium]|nr:MAG: hypothetical protein KatS3mg129_2098 [Leptospiraceae bacterium]